MAKDFITANQLDSGVAETFRGSSSTQQVQLGICVLFQILHFAFTAAVSLKHAKTLPNFCIPVREQGAFEIRLACRALPADPEPPNEPQSKLPDKGITWLFP